jgi:hypothetical protein
MIFQIMPLHGAVLVAKPLTAPLQENANGVPSCKQLWKRALDMSCLGCEFQKVPRIVGKSKTVSTFNECALFWSTKLWKNYGCGMVKE